MQELLIVSESDMGSATTQAPPADDVKVVTMLEAILDRLGRIEERVAGAGCEGSGSGSLRLLTKEAVTSLFPISVRTLDRWRDRGLIKDVKMPGSSKVFFRREDIDDCIARAAKQGRRGRRAA